VADSAENEENEEFNMTKKHFIALADALKAEHEAMCKARIANSAKANSFETGYVNGCINGVSQSIAAVADVCAAANPRFNRGRWLAYIAGECGPNGGAVRK
jgi:hypothetical protein